MVTSATRILEEYLVAGVRLGDSAAAERLVALRGPRLLAHAARLLGDREEARDVVQEAWLEIFRDLRQLRDERAFPAWAHRIVTRRANRSISAAVRRREVDRAACDLGELQGAEEGPRAADARTVRSAIAALPPDQRATMALFYLEEMSVAEVAYALDVPPGTVKSRLMHARQKLTKAMKGDDHEQAR